MKSRLLAYACLAVLLAAVACKGLTGGGQSLTAEQALDLVWPALEPNTSSHDRANWEVISVEKVGGRDVAEEFDYEPAPGCPGPEPPPNQTIEPGKTYWLVFLKPTAATPRPEPSEWSPTAPPLIPEAFLRQAQFLIDPDDGAIVARRLGCVIY